MAPKKKKGKKKKKTKRVKVSIDIDNFLACSRAEGGGVSREADTSDPEDPRDLIPPPELSPRSAAEYARVALKKAAAKRKLRKKKKKKKEKKEKKKKRRKRRKKKKRKGDDEEDDIVSRLNPASKQDEHYYPTPRSLLRKRCMFVSESTPVQCSICSGMHYR